MITGARRFVATILTAATLLWSTPATTQVAQTQHTPSIFLNLDLVRKIVCNTPEGGKLGTAAIIHKDIMMTAAHVIEGATSCYDERSGVPLVIYYVDERNDFALLTATTSGGVMSYECTGFVVGKTYYAIGFAHGKPLVLNPLVATGYFTAIETLIGGKPAGHLSVLTGDIFQGMSGGPIINEHGRIVGMNTATNHKTGLGFSRSLSDTILCGSPHP